MSAVRSRPLRPCRLCLCMSRFQELIYTPWRWKAHKPPTIEVGLARYLLAHLPISKKMASHIASLVRIWMLESFFAGTGFRTHKEYPFSVALWPNYRLKTATLSFRMSKRLKYALKQQPPWTAGKGTAKISTAFFDEIFGPLPKRRKDKSRRPDGEGGTLDSPDLG